MSWIFHHRGSISACGKQLAPTFRVLRELAFRLLDLVGILRGQVDVASGINGVLSYHNKCFEVDN